MTNGSKQTTRLVLSDLRGLGKVHVELEAFFDYSFTLAEDLQDLVARWSHTAAPIAIEMSRPQKPKPR